MPEARSPSAPQPGVSGTRPGPARRRVWIPLDDSPTLAISNGAEFQGLVVLQRPARIDGGVKGEILSDETLWIGEDARIEASICAANLIVEGTIVGDVRADGRVALESSAHVSGEMTAGRLTLVEGSQLQGSCRAGTAARPATGDAGAGMEEERGNPPRSGSGQRRG